MYKPILLVAVGKSCLKQIQSVKKRIAASGVIIQKTETVTVYEHGPLTLAETAKRMGISLSRVKQIEQAALEKLKKRKIFDF